ncbi:alcohol acetyltransferase [Pilobolus umbonatus]|nr:alcohol acetyltransferase [Pilobolus umbonatus]
MDIATRRLRPLGILEKFQVSKQLIHAYGNITLTAHLEHEINPHYSHGDSFYLQHFYPVITRLIHQHPMLSMIIKDFNHASIQFEQLTMIDVSQLICIEGQASLEDSIKKETSTEFDLSALVPLWRLLVMPESDRSCSVILTAHHAIMDGMSLSIFWNDFLQNLQSITPCEKTENWVIECLEQTPDLPYEQCSLSTISLLDIVPVLFKSLVPKLLPNSIRRIIDPASDGWKGDYPAVEGEPHQTEIEMMCVPNTLWKPIMNEAKKRGVSAHAILYAAMLLTWSKLYPGRTAKVETPINCRKLCHPPMDKVMGNYVGDYTSVWTGRRLESLLRGKDIWKLATHYYSDLKSSMVESSKVGLYLKYLPQFPASYCDFWYDKRKSEEKMGRTGGLELSDLGFFPYKGNNDTWRLTSLYFCQSAQIYTSVLGMNSVIVNDTLFCTLNWQRGSIDPAIMSKYKQVFMDILKNINTNQLIN